MPARIGLALIGHGVALSRGVVMPSYALAALHGGHVPDVGEPSRRTSGAVVAPLLWLSHLLCGV